MKMPLVPAVLSGSILFAFVITGATLLVALLLGGLPNSFQWEALSDPAFLKVLWQANPAETARLVLMEEPWLVVEQRQAATGLQLWGLYFYAGTLFVCLSVSIFTALCWRRLKAASVKQRVLFLVGLLLVVFSVMYLRLLACCGSGPGWVLETWLLSRAYMPDAGGLDWVRIYTLVQAWLPALQAATLLVGSWLLASNGRGARGV